MRSVLVTGASSGFGRNAAIALAADGWHVFASMRDVAKGESLADEGGEGITLLPLDVTDAASVEAAVAQAEQSVGGALDAVLNNAGYSVLGAFEDLTDAACRQQMETNFFGTLAVTRAVLPAMRRAGGGRIVIVTSNAVNAPHPLLTMYAASKWALEGWAEGLAMEVAPFGVEVCVVQPGAHRTPFANNVQFAMPEDSAYRPLLDAAMPGIGDLDRWGRDAAAATAPIVAAAGDSAVPFRSAIGEDTQAFAWMKATLPYEARALALRLITGFPGAGALLAQATPVERELAEAVSKRAAERPDEVAALLRMIAGR